MRPGVRKHDVCSAHLVAQPGRTSKKALHTVSQRCCTQRPISFAGTLLCVCVCVAYLQLMSRGVHVNEFHAETAASPRRNGFSSLDLFLGWVVKHPEPGQRNIPMGRQLWRKGATPPWKKIPQCILAGALTSASQQLSVSNSPVQKKKAVSKHVPSSEHSSANVQFA